MSNSLEAGTTMKSIDLSLIYYCSGEPRALIPILAFLLKASTRHTEIRIINPIINPFMNHFFLSFVATVFLLAVLGFSLVVWKSSSFLMGTYGT